MERINKALHEREWKRLRERRDDRQLCETWTTCYANDDPYYALSATNGDITVVVHPSLVTLPDAKALPFSQMENIKFHLLRAFSTYEVQIVLEPAPELKPKDAGLSVVWLRKLPGPNAPMVRMPMAACILPAEELAPEDPGMLIASLDSIPLPATDKDARLVVLAYAPAAVSAGPRGELMRACISLLQLRRIVVIPIAGPLEMARALVRFILSMHFIWPWLMACVLRPIAYSLCPWPMAHAHGRWPMAYGL